MQDFKEASAEIKVKTKRFSLKKGTIKICFELPEEKGQIRSLKLKLRNEIMDVSYPFILHTRSRGNRTVYRAEINVNAYPMERHSGMLWLLLTAAVGKLMMRSWVD